jgi:hypothetical protein
MNIFPLQRMGYPFLFLGGAPIVNAAVNIGDVTIDLTPANVNLVAVNDTVTAGFTIPAGAIRGHIKNLGGESMVNITVNGQELAPGDIYPIEAVYKGDQWLLPPAYVVVNPGGALVSFYYEK